MYGFIASPELAPGCNLTILTSYISIPDMRLEVDERVDPGDEFCSFFDQEGWSSNYQEYLVTPKGGGRLRRGRYTPMYGIGMKRATVKRHDQEGSDELLT